MANNDDIIKQLRAEVDESKRLLKEKDRALEEKDRALEEKDRALEEKDRALIMQRYVVFMEERELLSRCIRRCSVGGCRFIH